MEISELYAGQIMTFKEINATFHGGYASGVKKWKEANTFLLTYRVTDGAAYADSWDGDVLRYVGTDSGSDEDHDQVPSGSNNYNGQLWKIYTGEYTPAGARIFVAEQVRSGVYRYLGEVEFAEAPYMEAGHKRNPEAKVYIFPLRLKRTDEKAEKSNFSRAEEGIRGQGAKRIQTLARDADSINVHGSVVQHVCTEKRYGRNPAISAWAKERADGRCDLCGQKAPFLDKSGRPYLECHHIEWLAHGGDDRLDNVVALCPNCHRKMHALNLPSDVASLKAVIVEYDGNGLGA